MTSANARSEEAVVKALASRGGLTSAEIASATGLGRSTIGKTLAALERAGAAHRSPGGPADGRRLPACWSLTSRRERSPERLSPGELDGLVLEFVNSQTKDTPVGVTAVATALGRSASAVGNCLARLATAERLEQVSERPSRYRRAISRSSRRAARRRSLRGTS
jgi:DNA-binding IclR family transcriptional regulator